MDSAVKGFEGPPEGHKLVLLGLPEILGALVFCSRQLGASRSPAARLFLRTFAAVATPRTHLPFRRRGFVCSLARHTTHGGNLRRQTGGLVPTYRVR